MMLKKQKLNTESRFGFKIRAIVRMWRFLQAWFSIEVRKNKAVGWLTVCIHYLATMSSLK